MLRRMCTQIPVSVIQKLEANTAQADDIIATLRKQLQELQRKHGEQQYKKEIAALEKENGALEQQVEVLKERLTKAEINNGKNVVTPANVASHEVAAVVSKTLAASSSEKSPDTKPGKQGKKKKEQNDAGKSKKHTGDAAGPEQPQLVDVSRLSLKIGRIRACQKHPDADTLYVEEVDVGEGEDKSRTVVSGLVKHVPIEQMSGRLAVFMCNLKAAKMRGVLSQAMIMCASTPERVEILVPPDGVLPGDVVTCPAYPGSADEQLNPKRKVWEQVSPDLKVNSEGVATYKGAPLEVTGKGIITAPTLTDVQIK